MTTVTLPGAEAAALPTHDALDTPVAYRLLDRRDEGVDVTTLFVHPLDGPLPPFEPAQFSMIGVAGVGEAPISISTPVDDDRAHGYTIRRAGAVTNALVDLEPGAVVTIRGPFGRPWDLNSARDRDLVFVAGGIGIAPLRAAIHAAIDDSRRTGSVTVLVGATDPSRLGYADWLDEIERRPANGRPGVIVERTVDAVADLPWDHAVGFVTELVADAVTRPETELYVCGPDPMMRATIAVAASAGIPPEHVQVTLERNMHCGVGWCGHCQLGSLLVCRDGPVVRADELGTALEVPEL